MNAENTARQHGAENAKGQAATDRAKALMPEVRRMAKAMSWNRARTVTEEDLVGAGCLGLATALARGDLADEMRFRAYAAKHIRGAMLDELRRGDPLTRDQRKKVRLLTKARDELSQRFSIVPASEGPSEAAPREETKKRDAERLLASCKVLSLDRIDTDRTPLGTPSVFPWRCADAVETKLDAAKQWHVVQGGMICLTKREREVLELDLAPGTTPRQIAETIGVSESRVSQLRSAAVKRLREHCAKAFA
jgi:RNA polymerase sigma factor for flagellar operon FliA